jgi:hypothetical protein
MIKRMGTVKLDEQHQIKLRAFVEREGFRRFSLRAGVGCESVARGIAGLPLRRGTAFLIVMAIESEAAS